MITLLTTTAITAKDIVPWIIAGCSLILALYTAITKKAGEQTAVITKLEMIQQAVDKTGSIVEDMQQQMHSIEHRVTTLEVKFSMSDGA